MANEKISTLPAVASLTGAELFETVQSGGNYKVTLDDLFDYIQPILGDGTVGQVVKVKTINGGGNIILLEDSHTNEGANLIRTEFIGGTSKDYQLAIGDSNFEGGRLFIHAEGAISTSDFTVFDSDYSTGIVSAIDSMEIAVKDLVNAVDLTRITLSTTGLSFFGELLGYSCTTYPDKLIDIEGGTGVIRLGDVAANVNGTYMIIDDTDQEIEFSNNLRVSGGSHSPSGNYLKVTVAGTPQLIELLTP